MLARVERVLRGEFFAGDCSGLVDVAFAPAFYRFALLTKKTGIAFIDGVPEVEAWAKRLVAQATRRTPLDAVFAPGYFATFSTAPGGPCSVQ